MKDLNNNRIEELLPRYCEGRLSEGERLEVEAWMDESEENKRVATQTFALYAIEKMGKEKKSLNYFNIFSRKIKIVSRKCGPCIGFLPYYYIKNFITKFDHARCYGEYIMIGTTYPYSSVIF